MATKTLIFGFILLLSSVQAFGNDFVLVSDLDDTLKITNAKRTRSMLVNALFTKKTFLGMPTLYKALEESNISEAYLLSASPFIVKRNLNKLLRKFDLNFKQIYLRGIRDLINKKEYKLNRLRRIIKNTSGKLILFGDNQSIDTDIYLKIKNESPERIHKIYIHQVKANKISDEVFAYVTPFEVALDLKEILNEDQIYNVFNKLSTEKNVSKIIPSFSFCPKTSWIKKRTERVQKFEDKIILHCKNKE